MVLPRIYLVARTHLLRHATSKLILGQARPKMFLVQRSHVTAGFGISLQSQCLVPARTW